MKKISIILFVIVFSMASCRALKPPYKIPQIRTDTLAINNYINI